MSWTKLQTNLANDPFLANTLTKFDDEIMAKSTLVLKQIFFARGFHIEATACMTPRSELKDLAIMEKCGAFYQNLSNYRSDESLQNFY